DAQLGITLADRRTTLILVDDEGCQGLQPPFERRGRPGLRGELIDNDKRVRAQVNHVAQRFSNLALVSGSRITGRCVELRMRSEPLNTALRINVEDRLSVTA